MHGLRFHRSIKSLIGAMLLFGGMLFMIVYEIHDEASTRDSFRQMYGENWEVRFEQRFGSGSLEKAHVKTMVACASITVITILIWLIYRQMTGFNSGRSGHRPHAKHRQNKW